MDYQASGGCDAFNSTQKRAADRLAYAVAICVARRVLDERSAPADALLDYLEIGQPGGPLSVPQWVEQYEAANNIKPTI